MNVPDPLSNDEENAENSIIIPESKRTRFLSTCRQQRFPFRASVMLYIAENPTLPKTYLKMIETCKFFFIQNPAIVLSDLNYNGYAWQTTVNDYRKPSIEFLIQNRINFQCAPFFDGVEWQNKTNDHFETSIHLSKFKSKLWITESFGVKPRKDIDQNFISSLIPKIFRFDAEELFIVNQIISMNDYVYLASSVESVFLRDVTVKDENGSDISIEMLVAISSKARMISCTSDTIPSNITSKTFGELLKLPHFHQLEYFTLRYIPECFDLEAFYSYMKQNQRTLFEFEFTSVISEAYKNRLEGIVEEILATENPEYCIPLIHFPGIDREKYFRLRDLSK